MAKFGWIIWRQDGGLGLLSASASMRSATRRSHGSRGKDRNPLPAEAGEPRGPGWFPPSFCFADLGDKPSACCKRVLKAYDLIGPGERNLSHEFVVFVRPEFFPLRGLC